MRLSIVCIVVLAFVGCTSPAADQKVEQIYGQYCANCHGADLRGAQAQSLVDGRWLSGASDEAIARSIRAGDQQTGMPPYEDILSDDQIRALVVYIREHEHRAQNRETPPPRPKLQDTVQTALHTIAIEPIVTEGLTLPWAVEPLPDGRLVVTERPGRVRVVASDGTLGEPLSGTPQVLAKGQGGMLDVAVHPDYAENGWIYLGFSEPIPEGSNQGLTTVVRGRIKDHAWVDQEVICRFDEQYATRAGHHFGTRIVLQDGYVFFTVGDRGKQERAQQLEWPNGSVFRVHDDGRVPVDNPFADQADAVPEIWSYGHRNPQGLAWHPLHQALYSSEHGPRGGDELNVVVKGENYGWPEVTHGINYNGKPITGRTTAPEFKDPIKPYTPSPAFCGLSVVTGDEFPQWQGDLLLGGLRSETLRRVRVDEEHQFVEEEILFEGMGRVRDVVTDRDGSVLVVFNDPGVIARLRAAE